MNTLKTKVAQWYDDTFGMKTEFQDDMGKYIDKTITFQDVADCIENKPNEFYSLTGVSDSVVRERVFTELARILKVDYDRVYKRWLDKKAPSLYEAKCIESVDAGVKSKVVKTMHDMLDSDDHEGTWYVDLGTYDGKRWAVAMAFMDWDNNDDWTPYAKVAYQPKNSIMQCDYDVDWEMPYDEVANEVFDTEIMLNPNNLSADADYLLKDWDVIYNKIKETSVDEAKQLKEDSWEKIRVGIIQSYLMEGHSLNDAIRLAEDTITPDTVYRLKQTPGYKEIQDDVAHFFKICDDVIDYKKTIFKDDPIAAFNDEADFCEDVADFLGSINLKGFGPEFTKPFMQDTAKTVDHLDHSATELRKLLKKQDRSTYIDDTGKPKPRTNQRPGEYAKRALKALGEFFAKFGVEFDYDPGFDYKSVMPDSNYEMISDLEDLQVKLDRVSGENKSVAKELIGKVKEMLATVQSGGKVGKRDVSKLAKQVAAIAESRQLNEANYCWHSVECVLILPDDSQVDALEDKLYKEFADYDPFGDYYEKTHEYEFRCTEKCAYSYSPETRTGVMTGDPAYFEPECGLFEEDFEEFFKQLQAEGFNFKVKEINADIYDFD